MKCKQINESVKQNTSNKCLKWEFSIYLVGINYNPISKSDVGIKLKELIEA